jgi:hypothetical protein
VDVDRRRTSLTTAVAENDADFTLDFAPHIIQAIDAGERVIVLSGVHVGCFELFGQKDIHGIADLKGKGVGINLLGLQDTFLTAIAANVGPTRCQEILGPRLPRQSPLTPLKANEHGARLMQFALGAEMNEDGRRSRQER